MKKNKSRRLFLKGAGGYLLALPTLEIMLNSNGTAYAQGGNIKSNYIMTFHGESSGHTYNRSQLFQPQGYGNLANLYNQNPNDLGFAGLRPLNDLGLWNDVNVISNMGINQDKPGTPGNIQIVGAPSDISIHQHANYVVNSGYGLDKEKWWRQKTGKYSVDQAIYNAINKEGKLMNYSTEKSYDGWRHSTSIVNGTIQPAERNIGRAFDALFTGFQAPVSNGQAVPNASQETRRSILSLVLEDHKRLKKKLGLGYNDRMQVDEHMQRISDLEKAIVAVEAEENLICQVPERISENFPEDTSYIRTYGRQQERAPLWNELITIAVSCGLSRVANYAILRHKAIVPTAAFIPNISAQERAAIEGGRLKDIHEVGHTGTRDSYEAYGHVMRWVTATYGDLVKRFKDVKVGDGTLLDHSFIMMAMLQGRGNSTENNSSNTVHSYENMGFIQAGGKALGAKTGNHINGNKRHPISVSNSAAEMMGLNGVTFGDITDKFTIS